MLVRDGTIEKMFIEPQKDGDPFEVSDADTMLRYLDPKASRPQQVALLARQGCAFCARAKKQLEDAGVATTRKSISLSPSAARRSAHSPEREPCPSSSWTAA